MNSSRYLNQTEMLTLNSGIFGSNIQNYEKICALPQFCRKIHTSHSCTAVSTMHLHFHAWVLDNSLLHYHSYPGFLAIVPFVLPDPSSSSAAVKLHDQFGQ